MQYTDIVAFESEGEGENGHMRRAVFYLSALGGGEVRHELTGYKIYYLGENKGRKCYQLH